MSKKLTIGMACYNNYQEVWSTVQALRICNYGVMADVEFVVVDNNPVSRGSADIAALIAKVPGAKYIPFSTYTSTAVRNLVFEHASASHVMCVDSHILLPPDSISRLIKFFEENSNSLDLYQGPMWYDELKLNHVATHFAPIWSHEMFGSWAKLPGTDTLSSEPFKIGMQGLGLFACRKDAWLGFNPLFRGFGGEEGYIHEKFRQAGRTTWCIPWLVWPHLFKTDNMRAPYPANRVDKIRNYFLGHYELGLDENPIIEHWTGDKKWAQPLAAVLAIQEKAHADWDAYKKQRGTADKVHNTVEATDLWSTAKSLAAQLSGLETEKLESALRRLYDKNPALCVLVKHHLTQLA